MPEDKQPFWTKSRLRAVKRLIKAIAEHLPGPIADVVLPDEDDAPSAGAGTSLGKQDSGGHL